VRSFKNTDMKRLKNNIKISLSKVLVVAVIFGAFVSCDDIVDVVPESQITPESFYRNNEELGSALVGAYDAVQSAYSQFAINTGEFRSDNFQPNGNNASRNSLHNSTLDPGEGFLRWNNLYQAIDRVNRIIIASDNFEGADDNIVGQAYAIRSKVYFDIARVWGDIPVFLAPVSSRNEAIRGQTPYAEVINNIVIPDMLRAEALISTPQAEFNFSVSSVLAHQAEVYMWESEEGLAKEAIEKLLVLGTHRLAQTPDEWQNLFLNQPSTDGFPDGPGKIQSGPELIFSIHYAFEETTSGIARAYNAGAAISTISEEAEFAWLRRFPPDSLGWETRYPDTPPVFTQEVLDDEGNTVIEPLYGDWRHFATRNENAFLDEGFGSADIGEARCSKFIKNRDGLDPNNDNTNIPIFRFADMILLLAEAELKLEDPSEALRLINDVRAARQLPLASEEDFGDTFDEQLDFLLVERQLELFGEGKRWWDLVRNNKAVETMEPILLDREISNPFGNDRVIWPIFRQHLLENDMLIQNEGWR
jgi:hypothetical protein